MDSEEIKRIRDELTIEQSEEIKNKIRQKEGKPIQCYSSYYLLSFFLVYFYAESVCQLFWR